MKSQIEEQKQKKKDKSEKSKEAEDNESTKEEPYNIGADTENI